MPQSDIIYLACPYSHDDPAVRENRFQAVSKLAAALCRAGILVFSPISHSHPLAQYGGLPGDWGYWEKVDKAFMAVCDIMVIYMLDGWDTSRGVTKETKLWVLSRKLFIYHKEEAPIRDLIGAIKNG